MLELSSYVNPNINILKNEIQFLNLQYCPPEQLPYFRGHFPDYPVLPAVAVLDITVFLISEFMNLENQNKSQLHIQKLEQLKIKSGIKPEQKIRIEITNQKNSFSTTWFDDSDQIICQANFIIQFFQSSGIA